MANLVTPPETDDWGEPIFSPPPSDDSSLERLIEGYQPIKVPGPVVAKPAKVAQPKPKPSRARKERENEHFKSLKARARNPPRAPDQLARLDFRPQYPLNMDPYVRKAKLRACMICSVVRTQDDFIKEGCPNCPWLDIDHTTLDHSTSQVMEGLMTITAPNRSWIAKWLKIDGFDPGTYAMKVTGQPAPEVLEAMEDRSQVYIPRDGSMDHSE